MSSFIYVDNSNVWIQGKRVSAVSKGMALDIHDAELTHTYDNQFRLNFGELLKLANHEPVKKARLYGSRPPQADSLWDAVKRKGFLLDIKDRSINNKEKGVDSQIILDAYEDALTEGKKGDTFIFITGDADFIPLVKKIREKGYEVLILFWNHASGQLKREATKFISLDDHLEKLSS